MVKITIEVEGMACGMCEAHINDAVRRAFAVKKVTSSHTKGKTEIISEHPLDDETIKKVIADAGYTAAAVYTQPYEKKGFSFFKK